MLSKWLIFALVFLDVIILNPIMGDISDEKKELSFMEKLVGLISKIFKV